MMRYIKSSSRVLLLIVLGAISLPAHAQPLAHCYGPQISTGNVKNNINTPDCWEAVKEVLIEKNRWTGNPQMIFSRNSEHATPGHTLPLEYRGNNCIVMIDLPETSAADAGPSNAVPVSQALATWGDVDKGLREIWRMCLEERGEGGWLDYHGLRIAIKSALGGEPVARLHNWAWDAWNHAVCLNWLMEQPFDLESRPNMGWGIIPKKPRSSSFQVPNRRWQSSNAFCNPNGPWSKKAGSL